MKFIKKSFIILSFIFISLIYRASQNEEKKDERIENAIKFMLTSIYGDNYTDLFTLEYKKYNITFNNLKLLKPLVNNIQFSKEKIIDDDIYYKISNLNIIFIMDINIKLFSNPNQIIIDQTISFENNFEEIIFKKMDDYNIEFNSSKLNYINSNSFKNNKMSELDYFKDFNYEKNCTLYENGKNSIIVNDLNLKLKDIFKNIFEKRIKEIENNFNLLTYDITLIFNNFTDYFDINNCEYISSAKIVNIQTQDNFINLNKRDNILTISNIKILSELDTYFSLEIICNDNKNHIIYKINDKKPYIDFDLLENCQKVYNHYANIEKDIVKLINTLKRLLNQNADYYYNHILEL